MKSRPAQFDELEAAEFENSIAIFSLSLVFELQLWAKISHFSTKY